MPYSCTPFGGTGQLISCASSVFVIQKLPAPSRNRHLHAPRGRIGKCSGVAFFMKENKTITILFRITETQKVKLDEMIQEFGYDNPSRLFRDFIDGKQMRRGAYKKTHTTDEGLRQAINDQTQNIKKIGVNYNQAVRLLNELSKQKRPDGSPVIDETKVSWILQKLAGYTDNLRDEVAINIEVMSRYIDSKQTESEDSLKQ